MLLGEIIKPSTILVVFFNVLIFMFMEVLLFWYVISKAIENIIIDKSSIVRDIISNSTSLQNQLDTYVNSQQYAVIYNQSLVDAQERTDFNISLTWQWMTAPFSVVIGILVGGLIYTAYIHLYTSNNTLKLDRTDLLVLSLVMLAFLTEIIFIFVLVIRYQYVSDMQVIIFMMNSDLVNFGTFLPTFSPSLSFENATYQPF